MHKNSIVFFTFLFLKDYISIPQSNPDLDYIQTTECLNGYSPRNNHLLDYSDDRSRYGHPYGNFTINTNVGGDRIAEMYGYNNINLEVSSRTIFDLFMFIYLMVFKLLCLKPDFKP